MDLYSKDTTALVLGWAEAEERHIKAYTKFYAKELGIGAHGYIIPSNIAFGHDQG